jgi:hypothetical protein
MHRYLLLVTFFVLVTTGAIPVAVRLVTTTSGRRRTGAGPAGTPVPRAAEHHRIRDRTGDRSGSRMGEPGAAPGRGAAGTSEVASRINRNRQARRYNDRNRHARRYNALADRGHGYVL